MESTAEKIEPIGTATYSPDDNKLRLYAADRLDEETYAQVRAAGFRWAPKQELFVAPGWTPEREDLLKQLCGSIGDDDSSLVERAAVRADRFGDYSTKRAAEAETAHAGVSAIADGIPMGQPILVGHHSEKRARRDAKRIENGMRAALRCFETSQYWTDRAAGAISSAKYKERPQVRARRVKRLETDRRRLVSEYTPKDPDEQIEQEDRSGDRVPFVWCSPGGRGGRWVPVSMLDKIKTQNARWVEHLDRRLTYEKAMLAAEGEISLLDKPKRKTLAPLLNYRATELLCVNRYHIDQTITHTQIEATKAQLARVPSDYKGTRLSLDGSHRFRIASGRYFGRTGHDYVCVFLTDSKAHTRPESGLAQEPPRLAPHSVRSRGAPEPSEAQSKAATLRNALKEGVRAVAAPSLFETPDPVIVEIMEAAQIEHGQSVLEPSAGTGRLVRAAFERSGAAVVCVEINAQLCEILTSRGYKTHAQDFTTYSGDTFDRVVMNPPFERGQDREHVRHAFGLLKPGGRLVAIMSEGPFFRETRADQAFRAWLESVGGTSKKLPDNAFKASGTGVNTRIVVIEK